MRHFLPFVRRARVVMSAGAIALAGWASTPAWAGEFLIGTGVYDITGPAAETGMFGYAAQQEVNGLHQRLRAGPSSCRVPRAARARCS